MASMAAGWKPDGSSDAAHAAHAESPPAIVTARTCAKAVPLPPPDRTTCSASLEKVPDRSRFTLTRVTPLLNDTRPGESVPHARDASVMHGLDASEGRALAHTSHTDDGGDERLSQGHILHADDGSVEAGQVQLL